MTHSFATRGSLWLPLWLLVILTGVAAAAEELPQPLFPGDEWLRGDPVEIVPDFIVRGQAPRPAQPFDVFSGRQQTFDPGQERPGTGLGGLDVTLASSGVRPGTMEVATGSGAATKAPTTVTEMLEGSSSIQTTSVLRRSPLALEPYVRGYSMGQIYGSANGVYWTSARADLDSILSKMDPSLVEQMVVIPGPYGLRYGPGFAFIDIMPMQTPRYACGPENHNRAALTFRGNGGQVYGTDTVYGGAERYGYAVTYGKRVGSDYQAGNGLLIPSGYDVGNLTGQIGFDVGEDHHLELRYQSMDQRDTEYAGQFFDVDSLVTNAFSLGYVKGEPDDATRLEATGWYNRTEFAGTTLGADKRQPYFPVLQRVDQALKNLTTYQPLNSPPPGTLGQYINGNTDGSLMSAGARAALVFGADQDIQFRVGADCRFVDQSITENYQLNPINPSDIKAFTTNLPAASLIDPGLYAETSLNWTPYLTTTAGTRIDWAHTTAQDPIERGATRNVLGNDLSQSNALLAGYINNRLDINTSWTTHLGMGYSEITPDLFQRYANGLFLGIIQSGFSRVIGDPNLPKERLLQVDWDVEAKYDCLRGRAAVFYGWLWDYSTYAANVISDPTGARLLYATSTDRASLTGFELYGEYDLFPGVTPFAAARFVRGEDEVIAQPLFQIPPLEGTVGVRVEDLAATRPWGVECAARMVATQNRAAYLRSAGIPGVVALEEPTDGFFTVYLRGYLNMTKNLHLVGGVDNLFNRSYLEHLNLRLPATSSFIAAPVLSPGITPYVSLEWTL